MRSPGTRSMLAVLAAAALLAGCGESRLELEDQPGASPGGKRPEASTTTTTTPSTTTTSSTTTTTTTSEAEATGYPAEADQLCAQVSSGFAEAQTETPRSFEQAEGLMAVLAEIATEGEQALGAVTPPAEVEAAYAEYLAGRSEVVALIEEGLTAAQEADGEAYQQAMDAVRDGAPERERLALAAGLSECAAGERG